MFRKAAATTRRCSRHRPSLVAQQGLSDKHSCAACCVNTTTPEIATLCAIWAMLCASGLHCSSRRLGTRVPCEANHSNYRYQQLDPLRVKVPWLQGLARSHGVCALQHRPAFWRCLLAFRCVSLCCTCCGTSGWRGTAKNVQYVRFDILAAGPRAQLAYLC